MFEKQWSHHELSSQELHRHRQPTGISFTTWKQNALTYVNWVEALLHPVGGKDVGNTGQLVEQAIFKSE